MLHFGSANAECERSDCDRDELGCEIVVKCIWAYTLRE